ncbi:MAG: hypothetical protein M0Z51_11875 [Propionibacterium sp.]|nr:hypothetical protein [Propionibacterium sp.]
MNSNRSTDSVVTDVLGKVKHVADQAQAHAAEARQKADEGVARLGELTYRKREVIDARIDRAEHVVVEKIGAKHSDKVASVRRAVEWGLDRVADQRPATHRADDSNDTDGAEQH